MKENIGFQVYLKEGVKEADILRFQKQLDAEKFVKSTTYISKEEAAKIIKSDLDPKEDFTAMLDGSNPLPASIDVKLYAGYANPDSLAWIEKSIMKNSPVKEVYYLKQLVNLVNKNVKKIGFGLLIITLILLSISYLLIHNTIKLSIYSKRFLIRTMQLVGATKSHIRLPFLIKSIWHGLIASIFAIGVLTGIVYMAIQKIPDIYRIQDIQLYVILFLIVTILGIIFANIATFFAINKYLQIDEDELYNF